MKIANAVAAANTRIARTSDRTLIRWFCTGLALIALAMLLSVISHFLGVGIYHGLNTGIALGNLGGFELSGPDGAGFFLCNGQC
jgi:uncharacterized membrane protein YidH (DUF202 family)